MRQLTCKNLNIGYSDGTVAENISFHVDEGDYLCIIGENGAGKTTLMKTLLGLIPPVSGEIIFENGLISGEIGYMPQQNVFQRDFPASVGEIVLSGCLNKAGKRPFYTKEQKAAAESNMKRLGISSLASTCYRSLSGGQQQRVFLARALCSASKMLLLDEPAAGLDVSAAAEMYDYIKSLNGEGLSVIMITHDLEAAKAYASKTLIIGKEIIFNE